VEQLQRLSSTYKAAYYDIVLQEFDDLAKYCENTQQKLDDKTDQVVDLIWRIEDVMSNYDQVVLDINQVLVKKALENKIILP